MSSKKNYYQKYFTEHSNNVKKLWIGIKEIINVKYKSYDTPNCLEVDKESITDNTEICNKFNDYFSSIADNILKDNKNPILKTFDKYLSNPINNSFVFEPCTPMEVSLLINELDCTKGAGPNGIPTTILKMINVIIDVPFFY